VNSAYRPALDGGTLECMRRISLVLAACLLLGSAILLPFTSRPRADEAKNSSAHSYLGFDLNLYPGDAALPTLRKTFVFAGYWLSPPPGTRTNTWMGKREKLRQSDFGFLVLYRGRELHEVKTKVLATRKGTLDATTAIASARREGFPPGTIIFLDIEEGGRLPAAYHVYLRFFSETVRKSGYRMGAYCSGMPVKEEPGVTITTAEDIRNNAATKDVAIFAYNDACPPSPGCNFPQNPPSPDASGISYAAIWQFAQSPRRKEFAANCPPGYHVDGNCYAPGDTAHSWFLDVSSATSADPSGGK